MRRQCRLLVVGLIAEGDNDPPEPFALAAKPRQQISAGTHYVGRLETNRSKINGDDNERDDRPD